MTVMSVPILSFLIYFPLLGAVILLFANRRNAQFIKVFTLVISLIELAVSLPLFWKFDDAAKTMQFVEKADWFPEWGISYFLGIDGISLLLVLLTTFLTVICVLCSWKAIEDKVKEYYITFLFLETAMIGTLCALDLVLFYVFWELMLIPMYLLIGVWGGPRRIYAAIKFFLFTMAGSVLMLVAILTLYFFYYNSTGVYTFNVLELYKASVPIAKQYWLFGAFALSFAIKVPMFPVHTWLPDALYGSADGGQRHSRRGSPEDGDLRFYPVRNPSFPGRGDRRDSPHVDTGGYRHHLRRHRQHDAA